ncbi:MAG TPA: hypothetical protein VGR67_16330 [Candidatus Polarisedimenticolia bacterium]|jgi:hypothetical protein|nr:hypothetical protein [Candidatus Polarisedimenticolia bacterium]
MLKVFAVAAAALTMLLGGPAANEPATGKRPPSISTEGICPQIYAPVICDNGKVYPNQCVADQHHAKHCVPYGI